MGELITIDLQSEDIPELSAADFFSLLKDQKTIKIQIPLSSVNVSNSYIDIISDYLDASFAIESLASNFEILNIEKNWSAKHHPVYYLTINNHDPIKLSELLLKLVWIFQYPISDASETIFDEVRHDIYQYEETITDTTLFYPEIIDDYLANLINGAYYELDFDVFRDQLYFFPERTFGFWASAAYNNETEKVLLSTDAWIIPAQINPAHAFKRLGYDGDFSLLNSNLLTINNQTIAISEGITLSIPMKKIAQALACIEELNTPKNEYRQKFQSNETSDLYHHSFNFYENARSYEKTQNHSTFEPYISEFSDFFALKIKSAFIIIFDTKELQRNESERYINAARQLFSSFEDNITTPSKLNLPWHEINDEIFEQICYDIIYHNSKFDRSTIRKYGKSRSRDGGRDISVYTKAKPGEKSQKYIFQCKLSDPEKSIGTSKLGAITDILEQYSADGYGIMCNCYIDASLFDRLDAIATNRSINIETWSIFDIERFIARRPVIKNRYFSK
ncbi:hypothetical protein K9857_19640 [Pseudomonas sp. REP124]|uniref:hypothetical protein n=1 Tax=Pseudomonas sp. REP124 TaxID=2875731 RepID=UPI001CCD4471|nr:hypothetical protein [Pseudomonas sp. REP124]MBZ9783748.1 hypothetical protein [Pseudomonas sp. REP124]